MVAMLRNRGAGRDFDRSDPLPGPGRASASPEAGLPVGAARWVSVAGVCPASGTTTVAALLSLAYAAHRRFRIVAVDAHAVGGGLGARLATHSATGVAEIAAAAGNLTSFGLLSSYLDQNAEGAWGVTGAASAAPDAAQCRTALAALAGFFAVGVLDCGAIGEPTADALLESAHAPLLVAPMTAEGVLATACVLDWLAARRDTATPRHCGVALVSTSRRPGSDVGWAARLLTGRGARVIPVPYDPGLVAGRISPSSVSDGVWAAARRLGGEMLSRAAAESQPGWGHGG